VVLVLQNYYYQESYHSLNSNVKFLSYKQELVRHSSSTLSTSITHAHAARKHITINIKQNSWKHCEAFAQTNSTTS
jgi:hypothetical protein